MQRYAGYAGYAGTRALPVLCALLALFALPHVAPSQGVPAPTPSTPGQAAAQDPAAKDAPARDPAAQDAAAQDAQTQGMTAAQLVADLRRAHHTDALATQPHAFTGRIELTPSGTEPGGDSITIFLDIRFRQQPRPPDLIRYKVEE